jgi:hypothetical protein
MVLTRVTVPPTFGITHSKLPTTSPACVAPRLIVVTYDNGTNGFRSNATVILYIADRSADVVGGIRSVVPELKGVNVNVRGWEGRGVV